MTVLISVPCIRHRTAHDLLRGLPDTCGQTVKFVYGWSLAEHAIIKGLQSAEHSKWSSYYYLLGATNADGSLKPTTAAVRYPYSERVQPRRV